MNLRSKAFVTAVLLLGLCAFLSSAPLSSLHDPLRFTVYLCAGLIAACVKVTLPEVNGTMSLLFLFVLIGVLELSLAENLLIGAVAATAQRYWKANHRPTAVQLSFNVASIVIAIYAADRTYQSTLLKSMHLHPALLLAGAAVAFFVANTFPVAAIISMTEQKPFLHVWHDFYFWSFPYYMAGASIAGSFHYLKGTAGWQSALLLGPIVYVIYRCYWFYLDKFEEGKRHAEVLSVAAERVKAVLESTTDCVLAVDREWRITYMNQRAQTHLSGGQTLVGKTLWEAFPDSVSSYQQQYEKALNGRQAVEFEQFSRPLNAWFEVHAYPSADGLAIYLHDTTKKRELEDKLRQAHKMEALGRLAGGVAHDFNNQLTVILGYAQMVSSGLPPHDPNKGSIEEIQKAGQHAASLTHQLLAFSRNKVTRLDVIEINSVIAGMEGMLRSLIGEDIILSVLLDPAAGYITADKNQIEQIVMNLAANGRDAMRGGGTLLIQTGRTSDSSNRQAILIVRDTGHGIDGEIKSRIFDPFFTTKSAGQGTGLGLSIVYGIVQQSGGMIDVESELGKGSAFIIRLPAAPRPSRGEERSPAAPAVAQSHSRTILLVEDEASVRQFTQAALLDAGFRVIATRSGFECLRAADLLLESVDLLISDVVMPEMGGPEVADRLLQRRPALKVLYISGYSDKVLLPSQVNGTELNFLQKPFKLDELISKVEELTAECTAP